jgi:hypothetical protein
VGRHFIRTIALLGTSLAAACLCGPAKHCEASKDQCQSCCDEEHGEGKKEAWIEHRRTRMNGTPYDVCICDDPLSEEGKALLEDKRAKEKAARERSEASRRARLAAIPEVAIPPIAVAEDESVDADVAEKCEVAEMLRKRVIEAGAGHLTTVDTPPAEGKSLLLRVVALHPGPDPDPNPGPASLTIEGTLRDVDKDVARFTAPRSGPGTFEVCMQVFQMADGLRDPIVDWLIDPKDGAEL